MLEELERGPLIHAAQVMSRPAIAVRDDASAADAWRTLRDRRIHQALVLDGAVIENLRRPSLPPCSREPASRRPSWCRWKT